VSEAALPPVELHKPLRIKVRSGIKFLFANCIRDAACNLIVG